MTMQSFFYWGAIPLVDEITDDILMGLAQPKRTLSYARSYGAGISDYENAPITLTTLVMIKYEATKFMAVRNAVVTDGNAGVDRRAATSQDIVTVQAGAAGNIDVTVPFIMFGDLTRMKAVSMSFGGA